MKILIQIIQSLNLLIMALNRIFRRPYEVPEGYGGIRASHRADGKPKKDLGSAANARRQAIRQYRKYGEMCVPYRDGDCYYTGHQKNCSYEEWASQVGYEE